MGEEDRQETEIKEEEVISVGACKIFIDTDKNVRIQCTEPVNEKLSKLEVNMLHGLTDLVPETEENKV